MEGKKGQPTTVDEYIEQFPEEVQQILVKVRATIRESVPDAVEKISYQMPGYYLKGFLVSFAAWKRHIGFYPAGPEMAAAIQELAGYQGTKGSVHFPLDEPIPYELIRKIVRLRVEENLKKAG